MCVLKIMEWDSGGGAEYDEYRCIEAAPRRMRIASRRVMTRKRERSPRMVLDFEGKGGRRGGGTAAERQRRLKRRAIYGMNESNPPSGVILYIVPFKNCLATSIRLIWYRFWITTLLTSGRRRISASALLSAHSAQCQRRTTTPLLYSYGEKPAEASE